MPQILPCPGVVACHKADSAFGVSEAPLKQPKAPAIEKVTNAVHGFCLSCLPSAVATLAPATFWRSPLSRELASRILAAHKCWQILTSIASIPAARKNNSPYSPSFFLPALVQNASSIALCAARTLHSCTCWIAASLAKPYPGARASTERVVMLFRSASHMVQHGLVKQPVLAVLAQEKACLLESIQQ